ncbi:MAG TPA: DUF4139 domain-containing protein [Dongiaceae bacterium]|jgi:hypothetical protein|nr:DUF4139 domain-containing protein [Dongiaceae bacterium]
MRRHLLIGAAVAALFVAPAFAETPIGADKQTAVAVTIYNNDLALVRDSRTVTLAEGENDLAFIEVSAGIRPETALLTGRGTPLDIVEQNFDFDLLTPQKLLEKSVGQTIRVVRTNPETGADTTEDATVLSVAEGQVVLKIGDRIEVTPPGRLVYSAVPANLRDRPTLVVKLASKQAGEAMVDLSYLTHGLSWAADYVAELAPDEKTINLNGWVTLTNMSGIAYKDAKLQLVAGEVNQVRPAEPAPMMEAMDAVGGMRREKMVEEAAFEYHLYSLDRPTTLKENQTKQVALLSAEAIPVEKQYLLVNVAQLGGNYAAKVGETQRVNADVRMKIKNEEASHLGIPLPSGVVRVYKADSDGDAIFVGEDHIDHTPKNEQLDLMLGRAFDVTARGKQVNYERISDNVYENSYEIEVKNAKKEPVTVTVREFVPGDWKMLEESVKHDKVDASTAEWQVQVPAEGSAKLTYKVRIAF